MADYWAKIYIEIIDDPKMATMPDRLWRRTIELFLLAKKFNKGGHLPETKQLAWILRMTTDELDMDMKQIALTGIIQPEQGGWFVVHFAKRQAASTPQERMAQMRKREQSQQYYQDVTLQLRNVTQSTEDREQRTENRLTEADAEGPSYSSERMTNNALFCNVTKMACIPSKPAEDVNIALDALKTRYPEDKTLTAYLIPFWDAWRNRKTRDGRHYSELNCGWLTDWAVSGKLTDQTPVATVNDDYQRVKDLINGVVNG